MEQEKELQKENLTNYVFINFPPTIEETEVKRLLGKLEEFFPSVEFVFGTPEIWRQQANHILNASKAITLEELIKDDANKERALTAAKMIKDAFEKEKLGMFVKKAGKVTVTVPDQEEIGTVYFYFWEAKKALQAHIPGMSKITNKAMKELISFLELFGYIKKYKVEGKERCCLIFGEEDEEDFRSTKAMILETRIKALTEEKRLLESPRVKEEA